MNIHGEFEAAFKGQILYTKLVGSFNKQGSEAYQERTKALIIANGDKPFAMFIDILAIEGGTPNAYDSLDDHHRWQLSQPLVAKAVLLKSIAHRDILLQQSPALAHQNIRFFTDKDEAIAWLEQALVNSNTN